MHWVIIQNKNDKKIKWNVGLILEYRLINIPVTYLVPGGDSYMEQTGMLVRNFEFNP